MARPKMNLTSADVSPEAMDLARRNAIAKKARLLAEQELGIGEEGAGVVKGPAPVTGEEQITLTLDMYPGALELRLDGVIYRNGQTVTVSKRKADSILEIIARGWRHQEEIDGKAHNFYKPRLAILSGKAA